MPFEFEPFVEAMNRTFRYMAGEELDNGSLNHWDGSQIFADVSAVMGISGEEKGTLVLTVSEKAALKLTAIITGLDVTLEDRLVTDTIGELINIIVGSAQRHSVARFDFSIPLAIKGRNHEVRAVSEGYFKYMLSHMSGEEIGLYMAKTPL